MSYVVNTNNKLIENNESFITGFVSVVLTVKDAEAIIAQKQQLECFDVIYIAVATGSVEQKVLVNNVSQSSVKLTPISSSITNTRFLIDLLPQLLLDKVDLICNINGNAIFEISHCESIIKAFQNDDNLGMVGYANTYVDSSLFLQGKEPNAAEYLSELGAVTDVCQNVGMFANNSAWINLSILMPLLKLNNNLKYKNNIDFNVVENLFGYLAFMANADVEFIYNLSIDDKCSLYQRQESFPPSLLHTPDDLMHCNGIEYVIGCEKNIKADYAVLVEEISESDILELESDVDPIVFYLRYGHLFGKELVSWFNSKAYLAEYPEVIGNPLVHFFKQEKKMYQAFPALDESILSAQLINKSGLFDKRFYLKQNPDVAKANIDPLKHFCKFGWRELRNPNANFDTWQYWCKALNRNEATVNPLVHHIITGNDCLANVNKPRVSLSGGHKLPTNNKRVCLFAGYDKDGLIDGSVIDYIAELNKFADVYYLADSNLQPGELDKLTGITENAWAFRHGEYDFGSYSRLALHLVGWDVLTAYDEVLFANDSCYLIKPLNELFDKMDASQCDWWGMQATKGLLKTKSKRSNRFTAKIPLAQVKLDLLGDYEQESFYDFHVGSYFLAFRKPVLEGGILKNILQSVRQERNKLNIIRKYEIGLTRELIQAGHNFSTFIDDLYPFHPIYSDTHFTLVEKGMPLFKRFLLTENHYRVEHLWRWEERLQAIIPALDLSHAKENLYRISDNEKLTANFNIGQSTVVTKIKLFVHRCIKKTKSIGVIKGIYRGLKLSKFIRLIKQKYTAELIIFRVKDLLVKKNDNWWVFPVCGFDHNLTGNDLAVFEQVKNDASIKKIILTRSNQVNVTGENIEVLPLKSNLAKYYLLRSKIIFIKHSPWRNVFYPVNTKSHYLINLWHGIPLKRIGYASLDFQRSLKSVAKMHKACKAVICSSNIDQMAMASAFYPLSYNEMWLTGLPRIDFVLAKESDLPTELQQEVQKLKTLLAGRKLLLFCPTFKNGQQGSYYKFSQNEKNQLNVWLENNGYALGVREHMADKANSYYQNLVSDNTIELNANIFKHIEVIYRQTDVLITDYSSCFIDFMVTGKPVISFAYDFEHYINDERGLFYDLQQAIPGPVCKSFGPLITSLHKLSTQNKLIDINEYEFKRQLFYKYIDTNNSLRLVNKVKALLQG